MKYGKPQFELTRVYTDGSKDAPEIVPVMQMPWDTQMTRRGALGAGLTATAVLLLLGACDDKYNIFSTKTAKEVEIQDSPEPQRKAPDAALQAHNQVIVKLFFSSDSTTLVSSSSDNTAKQWSVPEGQLLTTIAEKTLQPLNLGITPDGKTLVADLGNGTGLWSLPKGTLIKKTSGAAPTTFYPGKLALAPEGNIYAVARNKGVELYSVPQGELLATLPGYENKTVSLMSFTPNGKLLVTAATGEEIKLWSVPDGKSLGVLKTGYLNASDQFIVNPESTTAAMINAGMINLWSLSNGEKLLAKYNSDLMSSIAITPDGKTLITIGRTFKTPNPPGYSPPPPDSSSPSPSFPNPPGASVETTIVSLWSFPEMEPLTVGRVKSSRPVEAEMANMAVTPDGKMLALAFRNGTDVWLLSLPDLKLDSVLKGANKTIQCLAVSPDGKFLATGDYGGTIRLWDLEKKEFVSYFFDKTVTSSSVKGVAYNVKDKVTGRTITYTLPCGSPIPPGAVCTCNCVPGTYKPPAAPVISSRPKPQRPGRSFGGGLYCTCNKVCTCIPVPSDRNAKETFEPTDPMLILKRLSELSIQKWNYKWDNASIRHIGPMAQDFAAAFDVGEDDKHISPVDAQGVAFAAIQALYRLIKEKDERTKNLAAKLKRREEENEELKSRIESLERAVKEFG